MGQFPGVRNCCPSPQIRVGQASTAEPPHWTGLRVNGWQIKHRVTGVGAHCHCCTVRGGQIKQRVAGVGLHSHGSLVPMPPATTGAAPPAPNCARAAATFGVSQIAPGVVTGQPVPASVHPKVQSIAASVGQPEPNCVGHCGPCCVQTVAGVGGQPGPATVH